MRSGSYAEMTSQALANGGRAGKVEPEDPAHSLDPTHSEERDKMKQIATMALLLNIGAAGVYAQGKPVVLALSGTTGASASNLQAGSTTGEDNFAGAGTLGLFTLRNLRAVSNTPSTSPTCSGA